MVGTVAVWKSAVAVTNMHWYAGLLKPTFAPPPWIASIGALGLAASLALAVFRVLGTPDYLPDRPAALRLFGLGLVLDAAWSWLFFGGHHPSVALGTAAALAICVALTAWRFAIVDRRAGLMLLPWVLAAFFTFLLDLSIALRNG